MIGNLPSTYFLVVNAAAFALYAWDKRQACAGKRRIPERALLAIAAGGGTPGALLAMLIFHHKTNKREFLIWLGVIIAVQTVIIW